MPEIEIGTKYKNTVEVKGVCPKGTLLTVWTEKDKDGKAVPKKGITGLNGFSLPNGGGVFFDAKDVEKA